MKVPSGTPLIRNEPIKNGDVSSLLARIPENFNGYLAVTGIGYSGAEEGMLLVENGNVTHAYYVHLKYVFEEKGDSSLKRVGNVFRAEGANVDVVELTVPKLKLTASFNEDARLSKPFPLRDLSKIIPAAYEKGQVINIMKLLPAEELSLLRRLIDAGLGFGSSSDLG
ncbi:MAG: hypothetical protein GXO00_00185 [Candidatus Diapherotrites archaeon]|nr:hypothetical protein [Candidatus Diapherotrites archaeon]